MTIQTSDIKRSGAYGLFFAYALAFLVLIVWPMPGTIAVRHSALALLLLTVFAGLVSNWRESTHVCPPKIPRTIYLVLTAWICLVILLWGQEPALSWSEFVPQWIVPTLVALIGWGLVRWSYIYNKQQSLIKMVFFSMFAGVVIQDLMGALYFLETGVQPFRQASVLYIPRLVEGVPFLQAFQGDFGERFSFVNNTFAAFVLAEIGQRLLTRKRWLHVPNWVLSLSLLAVILCSYWLNFRNGNIGLLSLLGFFGVLLIFAHRARFRVWQKFLLVGFLCVLLAGLAVVFVKSDPRWKTFIETAQIVVSGDATNAWVDGRDIAIYPRLSDGNPVEGSAYLRMSWIKEGLKMSLRYPMGTGFSRSAFFDTLDREFQRNGEIRGGHAHSGMIDFLVANGIPGAALWVAFLASCAWVGWGMVRQGNVAQGLTVVFLVAGFFNRSLLDSNIRDNVLQQFLFLLTIYMTIQLAPVSPGNHSTCKHEATA